MGQINIGSIYYFSIFWGGTGGVVVKAGACLGFSQRNYNYQPHKRDVVISSRGAPENPRSIFPESTTAYSRTFSSKCSVGDGHGIGLQLPRES